MIIRHKKWSNWSILMQMAAYIAKFAAIFVWFVWLCSNVQIVLWKLFKGGNYSRTETLSRNTVYIHTFLWNIQVRKCVCNGLSNQYNLHNWIRVGAEICVQFSCRCGYDQILHILFDNLKRCLSGPIRSELDSLDWSLPWYINNGCGFWSWKLLFGHIRSELDSIDWSLPW